MLCEVCGSVSNDVDKISDEIQKLLCEYDNQDNQSKIDKLKAEIEWLEQKV